MKKHTCRNYRNIIPCGMWDCCTCNCDNAYIPGIFRLQHKCGCHIPCIPLLLRRVNIKSYRRSRWAAADPNFPLDPPLDNFTCPWIICRRFKSAPRVRKSYLVNLNRTSKRPGNPDYTTLTQHRKASTV